MDIFCNNAGILNEMQWEKTVSVNLVRKCDALRFFCRRRGGSDWGVLQVSAIRGNYLALEHMCRQKGGRGGVIVNISSMAGEYKVLLWSLRKLLGYLTLYLCRDRSSALMSRLYGHQARAGGLHPSHGGEVTPFTVV